MALRRTSRRRSLRRSLSKWLAFETLEQRRLLAGDLVEVHLDPARDSHEASHFTDITSQTHLRFNTIEFGPQPPAEWASRDDLQLISHSTRGDASLQPDLDWGASAVDTSHSSEDHSDEVPEAFHFQESGYGQYPLAGGPSGGSGGEGSDSGFGGDGSSGPAGNGAAPNYHVNYVSLRDANGALVDSIPIGQMVAIQVGFSTEGIGSSATLGIRFTVNGIDRFTDVTWATGTGTWYAWWSGWYAGPGEQTFSIELDYDNFIAESDETDNEGTGTFTPHTPTDLPQKLLFPVEGQRNVDFAINNYADVDPRPDSRMDFAGGIFQYDGHNAWDLGPPNFLDQDQGLAILAAADGVVVDTDEGHFDRKTGWQNTPANYVIIDHGNNWNTIYWHLARDSVNVKVGQEVKAGDIIGNMGSSGISTGTHLHYTLRRFNYPVETMFATDDYYHPDADVEYQPNTIIGAIDGNISNISSPTSNDWKESFPTRRIFGTADTSERAVFNFYISHMNPGDEYLVRFVAPNGAFWQGDYTASQQLRFPGWYWWIGSNIWSGQQGNWEAQVLIDGNPILIEPFEVVSGAADSQIRLFDANDLNVNPGRTTPYDFGSTVGSQLDFSITNHGDADLLLGAPTLPLGFSLASSFPASVAPGADVPFTVQYDGGLNSKSFGAMRFTTSDPDLPEFWFNLEGQYPGSPPATVSELSFEEAALAHILGTPPTPFEDVVQFAKGTSEEAVAALSFVWEGGRQSGDSLDVVERDGVTVDGDTVSIDGTEVGTIVSDGQAPAPLVIELSASAIAEDVVVESLVAAVDFDTTSMLPGPRFLRVFTTDADGLLSTQAYKSVRVHEPTYDLATIAEIRYDDDPQQQSRIQTIDVEFDQIVTVDPTAFEVNNVGDPGGSVELAVTTSELDGRTIATLNLTGAFVTSGSLVDGRYELLVDGDKIIGSHGQAADVNGDGVRGGVANIAFHRFYGDHDGNEVVNFDDFFALRGTFGLAMGDDGYLDGFDWNDDEVINFDDFFAFRDQFGGSPS